MSGRVSNVEYQGAGADRRVSARGFPYLVFVSARWNLGLRRRGSRWPRGVSGVADLACQGLDGIGPLKGRVGVSNSPSLHSRHWRPPTPACRS